MSSDLLANSVLEQVTPHHLCSGCGTCVAVCPARALTMRETPAGYVCPGAAENACIQCGLCLKVCPGKSLSDANHDESDDPFLGTVRACYSGWARDTETCFSGASGGLVTGILSALFAKDEIDAALVTRWDPDNPLRPQAFWARNREELLQSQKSKYCMVPIGEQLRAGKLPALPADARLAVVGLPCHMHGIVTALSVSGAPAIHLKIGLFCDRTLSLHVIERLLATAQQDAADVKAFEYRHKGLRGWPGDVYVQGANFEPRFLDRSVRMNLKECHTPVRCRLCFDKFNVLADLSCGDGYGATPRVEGVSTVLVRSEVGEAMLASVADCLHLTPFAPQAFTLAHGLADRKRSVAACTAAYEQLLPDVEVPLPSWCREALPKVGRREIADGSRRLRAAMQFENAPTKVAAERAARKQMNADRLHRIPARLRSLIARALRLRR